MASGKDSSNIDPKYLFSMSDSESLTGQPDPTGMIPFDSSEDNFIDNDIPG